MELLINTIGLIALAPSPQGAMLAALERDGRALGIYTSTGRFWFELSVPPVFIDAFTTLNWSPDGQYVAAGTRQCQVLSGMYVPARSSLVTRGMMGLSRIWPGRPLERLWPPLQ